MDEANRPKHAGGPNMSQQARAISPENSRKRRQGEAGTPNKRRKSDEEQDTDVSKDKRPSKRSGMKGETQGKTPSASKSASIQINAQPTRPGHVRFGSEDPPEILEELAQQADNDPTDEDEEILDSDDDAPEDVSAAAAQATSKATQAQAARAVESQRQNAKKKRKEREARLQEQANQSARTRRRTKASELPDLLPENVLADESFDRAPTPPAVNEVKEDAGTIINPRKIRFEDDGPKDIQVGPVKVSVLRKSNKLLAPKSSAKTHFMKQQLLSGRDKSLVNRQSMSTGFLRR